MSKKLSIAEIRKIVTERAFGCCEYCMSQQKYANQVFSIEHIKPKSRGGDSQLSNLALACQGCNNAKFTKTEVVDKLSKKLTPLYNPRKDEWAQHFKWNDNFTVIMGISSIGRVTVKELKLNREFLINQRIIYRAYGVHPPAHSIGES